MSTAVLNTMTVGDHGSRVVFCHGLFGQGRNWTAIAKALSADHRSLLVDLPNHGRSLWTDDVAYPAVADLVASRLAELTGGEPFALVGHSMGGKIAMMIALRHPELVERLCVVDVSPRPQQLTGDSPFARYVRGMRSLDLDGLPDRAAADQALVPCVEDPVVRGFLLQNLRRDGDHWRWQQNLQVLGDRLDVLGSWPEVTQPPYDGRVLWVAGQRSDYITDADREPMRALFPAVRKVVIKNAGHWVHSEQPESFLATLRVFLAA
ncbi:alpha/beta fold hydrolase [Microlunatus parietis]|uniref:Pimeloyl-ACP methyl ester carboxylesterase n=1 Tax=Microlunatus parietis TaxID=682979 RepID=A0A7Y9LEV9_9ACTN|nr:alpha/beta fold hydrolase [Microlunatus parietis]NYE75422.1 pimeloyl-ACP methyl ester carboxylesterase [Microlunatus parietis]